MSAKSEYTWRRVSLITGELIDSAGLIFLLIVTAGAQPARISHQPILNLKVESIKLERIDMQEALRQLRSKNPEKILLGFEEVPHSEGERQRLISLELSNVTVKAVLDRLVTIDPRYTYRVTSKSVINVFPRAAKSGPTDLLNIRIKTFVVHGKHLPHNVITEIPAWSPELNRYLAAKARQYAARKAIVPPGVAGSVLSGGMEPEVHLELRNVTVREILNSVVLYSAKQLQLFSISWKYEFIIDSNARTGLGGFPRWSAF